MPNVGAMEIIIVLIIALIIFGPKRLPELGRSMGRGMREFKDSLTSRSDEELRRDPEPVPPEKALVKAPSQEVTVTESSETNQEKAKS